ncbi:MAG: TolB protein [Actinomycetota bacterium]|nr:TolB protein [Actinomycetota bacterium]
MAPSMKSALICALVTSALVASSAPTQAAFPGHNGRIVFGGCGGCERGDESELFSADEDGSHLVRLTRNARWDGEAEYSPDGQQIAFGCHGSFRAGSPGREICSMNSDGSDRIRVMDNDVDENSPTWSPDGEKISFVRGYWNDSEIWIVDSDGTNERQITNNSFQEFEPAWSPDGELIAFMSYRHQNQDIFVISPDGTGEANLTNSHVHEGEPNWSPDGSKIAYVHSFPRGWAIFVMQRDGSHPHWIRVGLNPAWAPNGRWIAFDHNGIFKVHPNGKRKTLMVARSDERSYFMSDWQSR